MQQQFRQEMTGRTKEESERTMVEAGVPPGSGRFPFMVLLQEDRKLETLLEDPRESGLPEGTLDFWGYSAVGIL